MTCERCLVKYFFCKLVWVFWYRFYYSHTSRGSVSPICSIFCYASPASAIAIYASAFSIYASLIASYASAIGSVTSSASAFSIASNQANNDSAASAIAFSASDISRAHSSVASAASEIASAPLAIVGTTSSVSVLLMRPCKIWASYGGRCVEKIVAPKSKYIDISKPG